MALNQPSASALERVETEGHWHPEYEPGFARRVTRGLWSFCRRKPLGAFGGLLVLTLLFMAAFGAGIEIGPVHIPSVAPYHHNEYELGRHKLESPSRAYHGHRSVGARYL